MCELIPAPPIWTDRSTENWFYRAGFRSAQQHLYNRTSELALDALSLTIAGLSSQAGILRRLDVARDAFMSGWSDFGTTQRPFQIEWPDRIQSTNDRPKAEEEL